MYRLRINVNIKLEKPSVFDRWKRRDPIAGLPNQFRHPILHREFKKLNEMTYAIPSRERGLTNSIGTPINKVSIEPRKGFSIPSRDTVITHIPSGPPRRIPSMAEPMSGSQIVDSLVFW